MHADNGADFRSRSFSWACREEGIKVIFRPSGAAHYGGHIERLIGTVMGVFIFIRDQHSRTRSPVKATPYDLLVQAMGGLMSITGTADGDPMKVGLAVPDIMTGLHATVAILAALNERRASDKGQHIDLALLDVQVATLANIPAK